MNRLINKTTLMVTLNCHMNKKQITPDQDWGRVVGKGERDIKSPKLEINTHAL